jgi:hypothetical protein
VIRKTGRLRHDRLPVEPYAEGWNRPTTRKALGKQDDGENETTRHGTKKVGSRATWFLTGKRYEKCACDACRTLPKIPSFF